MGNWRLRTRVSREALAVAKKRFATSLPKVDVAEEQLTRLRKTEGDYLVHLHKKADSAATESAGGKMPGTFTTGLGSIFIPQCNPPGILHSAGATGRALRRTKLSSSRPMKPHQGCRLDILLRRADMLVRS